MQRREAIGAALLLTIAPEIHSEGVRMTRLNHGAQALAITVVPDSGTGELAGLAGRFRLQIESGLHLYEFDYALPEAAR